MKALYFLLLLIVLPETSSRALDPRSSLENMPLFAQTVPTEEKAASPLMMFRKGGEKPPAAQRSHENALASCDLRTKKTDTNRQKEAALIGLREEEETASMSTLSHGDTSQRSFDQEIEEQVFLAEQDLALATQNVLLTSAALDTALKRWNDALNFSVELETARQSYLKTAGVYHACLQEFQQAHVDYLKAAAKSREASEKGSGTTESLFHDANEKFVRRIEKEADLRAASIRFASTQYHFFALQQSQMEDETAAAYLHLAHQKANEQAAIFETCKTRVADLYARQKKEPLLMLTESPPQTTEQMLPTTIQTPQPSASSIEYGQHLTTEAQVEKEDTLLLSQQEEEKKEQRLVEQIKQRSLADQWQEVSSLKKAGKRISAAATLLEKTPLTARALSPAKQEKDLSSEEEESVLFPKEAPPLQKQGKPISQKKKKKNNAKLPAKKEALLEIEVPNNNPPPTPPPVPSVWEDVLTAVQVTEQVSFSRSLHLLQQHHKTADELKAEYKAMIDHAIRDQEAFLGIPLNTDAKRYIIGVISEIMLPKIKAAQNQAK